MSVLARRAWRAAALAVAVLAAGPAAGGGARHFTPAQVLNPDARYPEGPQLLADGSLLSSEMPRDRVVRSAPAGTAAVWSEPGCGPTSVKRLPQGGYWVLCHLGHHVVRLGEDFTTIATVAAADDGSRITWPNDASVDAGGNLFLSSSGLFDDRAPATGRLIRIAAADNRAQVLAGGIRYANGVLVQAAAGRVLVSEHLGGRVLAFPLLGPDRVGPPVVFFDFAGLPPVMRPYDLGGPDGIAAFADGEILVANYGNGRLIHLSARGDLLGIVPVDLRFVTNMAIAPDRRSLYVTMTRDNSNPRLDGVIQRFAVEGRE
ncbi:SMP-30/gluconolactonase/LRE family protein [Zavarzinia compransoris]|uniref:SMP-30/Gluconolactonase/LRE-like region domain-containing protein n=1 Tax=Zavarzinia compransoris TaxID=1264899 RepID=A0A317E2P7_9PROT|nr:SMP-30/gluconolactonase/LRE family protein [Zavarzinia compransoris]PWR20694.1 hypothetical protein DKG75_11895 [Zavarzinia compransoris]TDP44481.1 gluconolactonase [Zavarzinia compransoris]